MPGRPQPRNGLGNRDDVTVMQFRSVSGCIVRVSEIAFSSRLIPKALRFTC